MVGMHGIEQRLGQAADVVQFDEFVTAVVGSIHVWRVILNFADDHRSDSRSGIGAPRSGAKLLDCARRIGTERSFGQRSKLNAPAGGETPERETAFGRAETRLRP